MVAHGRHRPCERIRPGVHHRPFEDKFTESNFFENVVVFGEGQKYAAALIVPDFAFLKEWCKRHEIEYTSPAEIIKVKEVRDRIGREVQKYNKLFGETEQIKRFELVADEWNSGNGILTPTLKVRRKIVGEKYKNLIDSMFV